MTIIKGRRVPPAKMWWGRLTNSQRVFPGPAEPVMDGTQLVLHPQPLMLDPPGRAAHPSANPEDISGGKSGSLGSAKGNIFCMEA